MVCEEDGRDDSVASVALIDGVVGEVAEVGAFGVQFPSAKDIKMTQRMEKRCGITVHLRRWGACYS